MDIDLSVRLILLLPLAGAVICGILPLFITELRRKEMLIGAIGTGVVAIPFVLAMGLFLGYDQTQVVEFFTWMGAGELSIGFDYRIDELSLLMTLIVTGVGALIHLYSIGYMKGDPGFWRFFSYLNLFIFAMLNLVLADNLVVLFLGWEGVGLCSYLLIGFWYTDLNNSAAANKAFIVNRVGDFAFLMAMFLIFRELGALDFGTILSFTEGLQTGDAPGWVTWAVFLLFIGATGKSAQIPLFVWLPDAMAGPTPVSALIHAATMVTSGLYLLARLSSMVLASPTMMMVIAIVGALTAIMAAMIAITQNDIKKVLAYSTVSQLGFMFMAAGVGAFFVAIFHVMTHAFFKGCLFLGAGSVIHGMHEVEHELEEKGERHIDPQDMRTMGGLQEYMPSTGMTYLLSTLAIAGVPFFSGFFSKDEILYMSFQYGFDGEPFAWAVWAIGIVTAVLTAIYMTRSYILTFKGEPRWPLADKIKPHESPVTMTGPLWVLAVLAVVGGVLGLPGVITDMVGWENWIHHYLGEPYGGPVSEPEFAQMVPAGLTWLLLGLGAVIALGGVYFAWTRYTKHGVAYDATIREAFGGLYRSAEGKFYWDEAYDRGIVNPLIEGSRRGLSPFDDRIIDGAVNGMGAAARGTANALRYMQSGIVQNYALAIVLGVVLVVGLMLLI